MPARQWQELHEVQEAAMRHSRSRRSWGPLKSVHEVTPCSRGCEVPYGCSCEALVVYLRTKTATIVETL